MSNSAETGRQNEQERPEETQAFAKNIAIGVACTLKPNHFPDTETILNLNRAVTIPKSLHYAPAEIRNLVMDNLANEMTVSYLGWRLPTGTPSEEDSAGVEAYTRRYSEYRGKLTQLTERALRIEQAAKEGIDPSLVVYDQFDGGDSEYNETS